MRIRETTLVAAREVRGSLRSRWFVLAAASFLVLSLGLAWLGFAGSERSGLAGFDRTTASLLNLALLFVPLVTLSLGGLGLAGELEDGSLALLMAQPLTRKEVFMGKLMGQYAAVSAALLTGFGATGVIVGLTAGGGDLGAFVALVALLLLLAAATLAIGSFLSVVIGERARVIGAAFSLWLVLVYLSDLGTIGLTIARNLRAEQVFVLGLLNPIQVSRVLGTLALSERLDLLGPVGVFALDNFGLSGTVLILAGSLLLIAVASSALAQTLFHKTVVS